MLCVKKLYNTDLLQLALVLSLLRLDISIYFNQDILIPNGEYNYTEPDLLHRDIVNPKSLDNILINYERQLFEDLNSLGRYNRPAPPQYNISAYLLNVERDLQHHRTTNIDSTTNNSSQVPNSLLSNANDSGIENDEYSNDNASSVGLLTDDYLFVPSGDDADNDNDLTLKTDEHNVDDTTDNLEASNNNNEFKLDNDHTPVDASDLSALDLFPDFLSSTVTLPKLDDSDLSVADEIPDNIFSDTLGIFGLDDAATSIAGELTQEDMDLIEVLWKQDVDLGFSLETEDVKVDPNELRLDIKNDKAMAMESCDSSASPKQQIIDYEEKLKAIEALNEGCLKTENSCDDSDLDDPWAGLQYTIDTETGEYVLKSGLGNDLQNSGDNSISIPLEDLDTVLPLSLPDLLFDDNLPINDFDDEPSSKELYDSNIRKNKSPLLNVFESNSVASTSAADRAQSITDSNTDEDDFLAMIQTAQFHSPHPHAFQSHMNPYVRMNEQRWQDVTGLLTDTNTTGANNLPGAASSHHHTSAAAAAASAVHHHHHHHHHHHAAAAAAFSAHHAVAALHHNLNHPHVHHPTPHHSHMNGAVTYGSSGGISGTASGSGTTPNDTRSIVGHNVTLGASLSDHHLHHHPSVTPFTNINGTNLGSAVATSINLTSTAESMDSGAAAAAAYKMENNSHDIMYFSNTSSEISNATDGFLSSILNDEDLQLMDMAMGDGSGMYPIRMLDSNLTSTNNSIGGGRMDMIAAAAAAASERMDASSDSAVSSMGSERIASLSDNEWGDATSDSGHTTATADHYALDYASKYRTYDYSYPPAGGGGGGSVTNRQPQLPNNNGLLGSPSDTRRLSSTSSVAQKKHHMFGKRFFQDQTNTASSLKYDYTSPLTQNTPIDIRNGQSMNGHTARTKLIDNKFPCTMEHPGHLHTSRTPLDHVHHNHTYNLPAESTGTLQRPVFRDKTAKTKHDDEPHLTRDEKRARALNVPLTVDDIINLPMDEFNERLSKFDLSEPQLSLIRDIRRRGKNKVAAQNCRKRKLDQILSLADEVKDMRDRKNRLLAEREFMLSERQRVKEKFTQLYRHVLRNLRDPDGNPYSPNLYSLQQSADGTVIVVPKSNMTDSKDTNKKSPQ